MKGLMDRTRFIIKKIQLKKNQYFSHPAEEEEHHEVASL